MKVKNLVIDLGIIREEMNHTHNYLSTYHIALRLVGYMSLYNALVSLNEESERLTGFKKRNLQEFLKFANTAMLKDFSIELNELYEYFEYISPGVKNKMTSNDKRFELFFEFLKLTKNNMKFIPKRRTKKIDNILDESKNKYKNIFGIYNKNLLCYCGYYMGQNLIFGSNWYYDYIFYEVKHKNISNSNSDLNLFTSSILPNMKNFFQTFNELMFDQNFKIPEIKLKDRK